MNLTALGATICQSGRGKGDCQPLTAVGAGSSIVGWHAGRQRRAARRTPQAALLERLGLSENGARHDVTFAATAPAATAVASDSRRRTTATTLRARRPERSAIPREPPISPAPTMTAFSNMAARFQRRGRDGRFGQDGQDSNDILRYPVILSNIRTRPVYHFGARKHTPPAWPQY